jgi:tRNA A37 threonylcarbamoyladenosine modification protein TsaB
MLQELESQFSLAQATLFAADIGPGSFTGVRVGVILAKTFAYTFDKPVAGASAFDLVSATETVVLPSKKGEYFVRHLGESPELRAEVAATTLGYGPTLQIQTPPHAGNFAAILSVLQPTTADKFVPEYLIPPSISQPKKPYAN